MTKILTAKPTAMFLKTYLEQLREHFSLTRIWVRETFAKSLGAS
ncbi:MAG: hypothetical protein K0Q87_394 [Neobacillus sp.]|jgi:hypothetical protein|nr:hypothetical protein [Neobacillus sp.]